MNRMQVTIDSRNYSIRFFANRTRCLEHLAKHYLSPDESWSSIECVTLNDSDRRDLRYRLSKAGCTRSDHSFLNCTHFDRCSDILDQYVNGYINAIRHTVDDATTPGMELYLLERSNPQAVLLGHNGVIAIIWMGKDPCVMTAYLPACEIMGFESYAGDQFATSLKYVNRKWIRKCKVSKYIVRDHWNSFLEQLEKGSDR